MSSTTKTLPKSTLIDMLCYPVPVSLRCVRYTLLVACIMFFLFLVKVFVTSPRPIRVDHSVEPGTTSRIIDSTNPAPKKKGPVVPQSFPVPPQCAVDPRSPIDKTDDSFCYKSQAAAVNKDASENQGQRTALCWPKAGSAKKQPASDGMKPPPSPCASSPAVFHTLADAEGNLEMLISSFLATQASSGMVFGDQYHDCLGESP